MRERTGIRTVVSMTAAGIIAFGVITPAKKAEAQESNPAIPLDPIPVTGTMPGGTRTEIGPNVEALPASTYVIGSQEIENKHVSHYTDVFRDVPGFVVSNYGQGGLASGVTMRGYSAWSHGQDMYFTVDGVPFNEVSGIHSQNYPHLAHILPETVERIEIVRGPFNIEHGDGNVAGSAAIYTRSLMRPMTSFSGGNLGTARFFGGYGTQFSQGESGQAGISALLAGELYRTDGYRDNSDDERYNLFGKVSTPVPGGNVWFNAQVYADKWGAPDYLRTDLLNASQISEKTPVSSSDGGHKDSEVIAVGFTPGDADNGWTATAYVIHSDFARIRTNPSSLVQQISQDARWTYGANGKRIWTGQYADLPMQFMLGGSFRGDMIQSSRWNSTNGAITGPDINADTTEHAVTGFGQVQVKPIERVKLTAGLRYDHIFYDFDDNRVAAQSTTHDTGVFSPKVGVAFRASEQVELFANYGQSFRSPSAVNELRLNPGADVQKVYSQEFGVHVRELPFGSELRASIWNTRQDNEIFSSGGVPQNLGKSERNGYDIGVGIPLLQEPGRSLTFNADYSFVTARLVDRGTDIYVPTVPTYLAQLALSGRMSLPNEESLHGTFGAQFYGRQHLDSTGVLTADPYYVLNGKLTHKFARGWSTFGSFRWYPDERYSEIALPVSGVWGTSPQPELAVLFGLGREF